jgi:hypothetical protein
MNKDRDTEIRDLREAGETLQAIGEGAVVSPQACRVGLVVA